MVIKFSKNSFMKKAVVFSMISFLISTLFVAMFLKQDSASIDFLTDSNVARINNINYFITSYELYIKDAIKISTISALNNLTKQIALGQISDGQITLPSNVIARCIDGTDNCQGKYSFNQLLKDFEDLTYEISGVKVDHSIIDGSLSVEQTLPFYLKVSMQINYTVVDPNFAYWTRTKVFSELVPIVGLEDPLYYWRKSYLKPSAVSQVIIQNPSIGKMNASEFKNFVFNHTYIVSPNSPSYLQRLSNLTLGYNSSLGIESVITPSNISSSYPVAAINRSYADYQIFELKTWSCDWDNGGILVGINSTIFPGLPKGLRFDLPTEISFLGDNDTYQDRTCN